MFSKYCESSWRNSQSPSFVISRNQLDSTIKFPGLEVRESMYHVNSKSTPNNVSPKF